MRAFLFICLGGALGTAARYGVATGMTKAFGPSFPVGTFTVNLLGSFLIAIFMYLGAQKVPPALSPLARLTLTTGFMGGFTTYSSFNYETLELARKGAFGLAGLNIALTVIACLGAGLGGLACGRWIGQMVQ